MDVEMSLLYEHNREYLEEKEEVITPDELLDRIEEFFDKEEDPFNVHIHNLIEEFLHALDAVFIDAFRDERDEEEAYEYVNTHFIFKLTPESCVISCQGEENRTYLAQAMDSLKEVVELSINGKFNYIKNYSRHILKTIEYFSKPSHLERGEDTSYEAFIPLTVEP